MEVSNMKQLKDFTTEYKQQTGRNFQVKMVPLEASKSKVYFDKQQLPRVANLASIDYTAKQEISIELNQEFDLTIAKEILSQLDLNYKMKPAYQRFVQGFDQETGVYDDDNDDDQTNNDGAFENWYSRNGAFAAAAIKDNDAEAYRRAFREINWSECNFEELQELINEVGCEITGAEEQEIVRERETIVCSKIFFDRVKNPVIHVPYYIKGQVLYREAIGDKLKAFIEDFKSIVNYDKMSLVDRVKLGTTLEVKDWNDGLEIIRAHKSIFTVIRPWLAEKYENLGGIEIETKQVEMLDMRINEYLSDAIEAITELENISDSMKLNPLTDAEYKSFAWLLKFPWIQWRTLKAEDIKA